MADKFYINDSGFDVVVDCSVDISVASVYVLKVLKPDATIVTWSASIYNTTFLKYTILPGDLPMAGEYKIQSYIESGDLVVSGATTLLRIFNKFR